MRDSDAFDVFYGATGRRVVAQVYAMIGDLAEAEDAVQEAYSRAWQRWDTVADCHDPAAWVRTVAYRIAISSWRRARSRLAAYRRSGVPPDADERKEALVRVPDGKEHVLAPQRPIPVSYLPDSPEQATIDWSRS